MGPEDAAVKKGKGAVTMNTYEQQARELYHQLVQRVQYPSDPQGERDARIAMLAAPLALAYREGREAVYEEIYEERGII